MLSASARAQTPPDGGVVRGEPVVVAAAPLTGEAGGTTRLAWDAAAQAPLGGWRELEQGAANFHVSDAGSGGYGSLFAVRGVANTPYFSDPAVTMYVADIPLASSFAYPAALMGFEAVTLERGPLGTRFGRATDGGVVLFAPVPRNLVTVGLGSQDERSATVAAKSGEAFVVAGYDARHGDIDNRQLGRRVDDRESESAYGQATGALGGAVRATLEAWAARSRSGAEPLVPLGGPSFVVNRAGEGVTDLDSQAIALRMEAGRPDGPTLRSVTSFTDWRMDPFLNFLVLPPALQSRVAQDQKSFNEELHAAGARSGTVQWDGGLWLSRSITDNAVNRAIPGKFPVEVSSFELGSETAAVFGEGVAAVAPGWQLTAGARIETTQRHFDRHEQVPVAGLGYSGEGRYSALLPRLALDGTVAGDSHVEAVLAWGMRPGGFSSYTANPALMPFAAERMTSASLGWDRGFAGGTRRVVVRLFHDQIGNYQIERSFSASDYFVTTAPRATADGAELEFSWRAAPEWTVTSSAGGTRAVLTRYRSPLSGLDLAGEAAPYIPRYNANLDLAWRGAGGWFAGARVAAIGSTFYDEQESPAFRQAAYALLAARAGWQGGRWTLTLYGENLTDRRYAEAIIPGVKSESPGAPRRGGAELSLGW